MGISKTDWKKRGAWIESSSGNSAYLHSFGVGSTALKPAHWEWIESRLAPKVQDWLTTSPKHYWNIHIEGRASRSGDEGMNLNLSTYRALRVKEAISNKCGNRTFCLPLGVGESKSSQADGKEFDLDRGVFVVAIRGEEIDTREFDQKLDELRRKTRELREQVEKIRRSLEPPKEGFQIRVRGGKSMAVTSRIGMGVAYDGLLFEVEDLATGRGTLFAFESGGIGVGIGIGLGVSSTLSTDDTRIVPAKEGLSVEDFGDYMELHVFSIGIGYFKTTTDIFFKRVGWLRDMPTGTTLSPAMGMSKTTTKGRAKMILSWEPK